MVKSFSFTRLVTNRKNHVAIYAIICIYLKKKLQYSNLLFMQNNVEV